MLQPALFLGHGNPMHAINASSYSQAWARLGQQLPQPRAILCVSAHWETGGTQVCALETPPTIHDFGGFPPALFAVQYPAPGAPELAQQLVQLLGSACSAVNDWGLDHGAWAVLRHLYPAADLPVVQLSLDRNLAAAEHYALAQQLTPLREQGVLILGSGNIVHNLARLNWQADAAPLPWAESFDNWAKDAMQRGDHPALINYASEGEAARLSVPTPEHYLPLLYILAQQQPDDRLTFPIEGFELGGISMRSVLIG